MLSTPSPSPSKAASSPPTTRHANGSYTNYRTVPDDPADCRSGETWADGICNAGSLSLTDVETAVRLTARIEGRIVSFPPGEPDLLFDYVVTGDGIVTSSALILPKSEDPENPIVMFWDGEFGRALYSIDGGDFVQYWEIPVDTEQFPDRDLIRLVDDLLVGDISYIVASCHDGTPEGSCPGWAEHMNDFWLLEAVNASQYQLYAGGEPSAASEPDPWHIARPYWILAVRKSYLP